MCHFIMLWCFVFMLCTLYILWILCHFHVWMIHISIYLWIDAFCKHLYGTVRALDLNLIVPVHWLKYCMVLSKLNQHASLDVNSSWRKYTWREVKKITIVTTMLGQLDWWPLKRSGLKEVYEKERNKKEKQVLKNIDPSVYFVRNVTEWNGISHFLVYPGKILRNAHGYYVGRKGCEIISLPLIYFFPCSVFTIFF